MIQVWVYDKDKVFVESKLVEEVGQNMTTVPLLVGYVKPTFTGREWIEGATDEEIKEWQETNKPKPQEPNKMEVLEKKVAELEEEKELLNKENKLLHAQVEVLSNTTDFHEELITEMAMKVYA